MFYDLLNFLGSLHPLVVHLPIGFVLLTMIFEFFADSKSIIQNRMISLGWLFTFISSLMASLFGWFLGDNGYYFESQIDIHRWSGILFVVVCFLVWVYKSLNLPTNTFLSRFRNVVVIILLTVTGHYGGSMTHGEDYLTENLPEIIKEKLGDDYEEISTISSRSIDSLFVYEDLIHPFLEDKCMACHNDENTSGGLNMTVFELLVKGGENETGISKGNAYKSSIFNRVVMSQGNEKFMPPTGIPLSFDQTKILEWWIEEGAKLEQPITSFREDAKIQKLLLHLYKVDIREKPFLETLVLENLSENDLIYLENENFEFRFLSNKNAVLDLKFMGENITKENLKSLDKIKEHVVWLSIIDSNLSDDEMTYLSNLKNLTRLKIQKNFISNKGVVFLEGLDNLSELNLYGTRITDASFEVFSKMKGLKKLFLWKTRVTKKGVAKFAAQYPNVEVMVGY